MAQDLEQDPLALPEPGTGTAIPLTPPPPAPPVKDFKKIILRQTARKFTSRPPPPRRPWPKPNYYCDYDIDEPITTSLFSSDVVFSKSVVESLFSNTRYDKSRALSSESSGFGGHVPGTTLRYGMQNGNGHGHGTDDDVQILAHVKPKNGLNGLTPTMLADLNANSTESQAKSKSKATKRPKPRSDPSTKKEKKKKDPLALVHANTNGVGKKIKKSMKSPLTLLTPTKIKHKTKVPPKKKQRLSSNNTTIVNGLDKLPPTGPEETQIQVLPSHLWSLPTLSWTQAPQTPTTATNSPPSTAPTHKSNPSKIKIASIEKAGPGAKKRPVESAPCPQKVKKAKKAIPNGQTSNKEKLHLKSKKTQAPPTKKSPSIIVQQFGSSSSRPTSPNPIPASSHAWKPGTPTKFVKKGQSVRLVHKVTSRVPLHALEPVQPIVKGKKVMLKQNDKNNNPCNPAAPASPHIPLKTKKTIKSQVKSQVKEEKNSKSKVKSTQQQPRINGIFKLVKKSPTITATANHKVKVKPNQKCNSISGKTHAPNAHAQINGATSSVQAPEANTGFTVKTDNPYAKIMSRPSSSFTATTASQTPPRYANPNPPTATAPARNVQSRPPHLSHVEVRLPVLKDTRIMVVTQPMINDEEPIDYSLKLKPAVPLPTSHKPKERTPERATTVTTPSRQLRSTPTKSYAHLTKRSCPCDCSGSH